MNRTEAFAILGIGDRRDAQSAMRKLAQIHHPDKGGTAARFQEIMDAYRLVVDKTYRMNVERLSFGHPYTERVFQQELLKSFRGQGAVCINVVGNVFQKIGIPDLYVASKIWIGWLELKTENEELRLHQVKMIRELRLQGVNVFVLRYRRKHGVVVEGISCKGRISEDRGSPIVIVKDWKKNLLSELAGVYHQPI